MNSNQPSRLTRGLVQENTLRLTIIRRLDSLSVTLPVLLEYHEVPTVVVSVLVVALVTCVVVVADVVIPVTDVRTTDTVCTIVAV